MARSDESKMGREQKLSAEPRGESATRVGPAVEPNVRADLRDAKLDRSQLC